MKFISWNIRGLNGAHKKDLVINMIRDHRPDFLMIQETKMKRDLVKRISFNKAFSYEASNLEGASRGVLILYNSRAFKLSTLFSIHNALLCEVSHIHSNDS